FDGNDTWDVALGSYYSNAIVVLPGNGNGTFGEPIPTDPVPQVDWMAAGDFNSDGHLDLALSTGGAGVVEILPGLGDGHFGPPSGFIAGASLEGIVSADL